jgi:hypothetical protein
MRALQRESLPEPRTSKLQTQPELQGRQKQLPLPQRETQDRPTAAAAEVPPVCHRQSKTLPAESVPAAAPGVLLPACR